jgi:multidrug efflux pump subunit AcrA (membrane-fusion protein)
MNQPASPSPDSPSAHVPPQPDSGKSPARRRWPRRAAVTAALIVALLAGAGIGSAITNNAAALSAANGELAASRSRVSTLQAQYSAAQAEAQQATTTADARAQASYAARNAALAARSKSLDQRAKAISTAEGQIQSSTISSDGVYVVGKDIPSGTYHTTGDGGQTDNECYFATLNSSNTQDIGDNNNFDGPETVDLSGAYAFQISGPCTWTRIG